MIELISIWLVAILVILYAGCAYKHGDSGKPPTLRDEAKIVIGFVVVFSIVISLYVMFGDIPIFGDTLGGYLMIAIMVIFVAGLAGFCSHNFPE